MEAGKHQRLGEAESGYPALLTYSGSLDKPLPLPVLADCPALKWAHSMMTGEPGLCSAGYLTRETWPTESPTAVGLVPV